MYSILLRSVAMATALCVAPSVMAAAPLAAAAIAPLAYTMRTLANGLRVYALPDAGTGNVSVQVWYDVGSKDDPAGRSGFAHMFEHLMFKATRDMVPEQMDRLTEDVGGYNNAFTADDMTAYYEVVPANHLQRLLWAEAERMSSLVVEPTTFASERDVVKEELRSGEARPYGRLFQLYWPKVTYTTHPYARPGIGNIDELNAATIDDIRAFHATYYRPDNAVLVVSGNFDPAQLDRWIDQYFGAIVRPDRPIPRVTTIEPVRTTPTSYTVFEDNTPLPAVLLSYLLPPSRSPDSAAFSVLDAILASGESSRLYQALVYRDQLAQSAETMIDDKQGQGAYAVYAIMAGGKSVAQGEVALRREVAALRDSMVTPGELDKAKNGLLTRALIERETAEGKASALARAVIVDGDPKAADADLAAIAAVTAADVQRVARLYLADAHAATIRYLPRDKAAGAKGDTIALAPMVETHALAVPAGVAIVTAASGSERLSPPPPAAPVPVPVPTPIVSTLANGMRLVVVPRHGVPLVSVALVAGGGAAADPDERGGAESLMADLLTKGTATRSATAIAQGIEALGGTIDGDADWDGSTLSLGIKADRLEPAMTIFADVALHPAFAIDEIERARAQAIDDAGIAMTTPRSLAAMVATKLVFGDRPYGHTADGTPASLKRVTRGDIIAAYRGAWYPNGATLVMVGDIDPANAAALAERSFGRWAPAVVTASDRVDASASTPARFVVVDMPNAAQAAVIVARIGIARGDPRYYPATVANATLGTGFSSRLNQEIRIKRGLAYGAGSGIDPRRGIGPIAATTQTKNETAPEATALIRSEMQRLGAAPIPPAELATRKAVLNGDFGRTIETTAGLADAIADLVMEGVDPGELRRYSAGVEAVTPDAIEPVAKALFDPTTASVVIVGDAKAFLPKLAAQGLKPEVIPAAALDLEKPGLR